MKIAIISDIHGNLEAADMVFMSIDQFKVDMVVALGDFVGYGSQPNEVIDLFRNYSDFAVLGNHDAAVVGKLDYSYHYPAAKKALDWTRDKLTDQNLEWLSKLKYTRKFKHIGFSHGSPIDPEEFNYIYTVDHALTLVDNYENLPLISFIGHSHLVKGYSFNQIMVNEISLPRQGFREYSKYLFSVGSVGQPRDGEPASAFVIFDIDNEKIDLYRVSYNIEATSKKIINAGLNQHFAKRLFMGI